MFDNKYRYILNITRDGRLEVYNARTFGLVHNYLPLEAPYWYNFPFLIRLEPEQIAVVKFWYTMQNWRAS